MCVCNALCVWGRYVCVGTPCVCVGTLCVRERYVCVERLRQHTLTFFYHILRIIILLFNIVLEPGRTIKYNIR